MRNLRGFTHSNHGEKLGMSISYADAISPAAFGGGPSGGSNAIHIGIENEIIIL